MKQKHIGSRLRALGMLLVPCSLLVAATGCSDEFMDTESKTALNSETGYGNADLCDLQLMGCYDGWQRTISDMGIGMWMMATMAGDECLAGAGAGDPRNNQIYNYFDHSLDPSEDGYGNTDWTNYYKGIYNCNMLLKQGAGKCGEREGEVMGQAHALRGLFYFDLARMFGRVPLLTEPTEENLPQASVDEVFDQIFADFKYAAENIPAEYANGSNIDATNGLIGKYAAEALMARAYLFYKGLYGKTSPNCSEQDAVDALNDIIANGGYDLEPDYKDLWMPACTEEAGVGEGKYAWKSTYAGKWYDGQSWNAGQGHLSKEYVLNMTFNTTSDWNGYSDGNAFQVFIGSRDYVNPPYASGWGACTVSPRFLTDVLNGDNRYAASVYDKVESGLVNNENYSNIVAGSWEFTGYFIKKFAQLCFSDGTREESAFEFGIMNMMKSSYRDWPIVRYADVLLMHSELTGDASGLNKVQTRAGSATTGADIENIRTERAKEFAFEGIRYWDLLRYGLDYAAAQYMKHIDGVSVLNGGVPAVTSFDAEMFKKRQGVFFIPRQQLENSHGVMKQNDGWL